MALSPDELEQIRQIVRDEIKQASPVGGSSKGCLMAIVYVVFSIIILHVIVIGSMTAYYLLHPH